MEIGQLVESVLDRIVGVIPQDDGTALLYRRSGETVQSETIPFRPFLLLQNADLLNHPDPDCSIQPLDGQGFYRFAADFPDVKSYEHACEFLRKSTGRSPTAPFAPYAVFNDFEQQILIRNRIRLFRNLTFSDVHRLQFDIETLTTEGYEFPNAARENDRIIIISMSDNTGWERLLSGDSMTEPELIEAFVATVRQRDPDIIEGHNLFRFDLPYLQERAKRHGIRLKLGRDGSTVAFRSSRFSVGERTVQYRRAEIAGRHVVDTYHLVLLYDAIHRDLEEYGLKFVAKHFGVAPVDRTYVEAKKISSLWRTDRDTLLAYALDDVRETRAIAAILEPSYVYQTQILPFSLQNCVVRGNATRIDAMLTAEYLSRSMALPIAEAARPFAGGLTHAFKAGVFRNVWHCDVRSLYPSIILAESWCPSRDRLEAFPRFLAKLREFRLLARSAEKATPDTAEKGHWNALQTSFKILINSFYGYLGFAQGRFNDFDLAESVTEKGREILTRMLDLLRSLGADPIEMDTDGIYFTPPPGCSDAAGLEEKIQEALPAGIDVEIDAVYHSMFCYKSKNYALLADNGEISVTGAALKSRGLEPFQRDYIHTFIRLALDGDFTGIRELTNSFRDAIRDRRWPLAKFAKTETLADSLETYRRKRASGKGRRSAAYELAVRSGRDYRQGDPVSYYVTGEKRKVSVVDCAKLLSESDGRRDENIEYYLDKIDELHRRLSDFQAGNSSNGDKEEEEEFRLE
jgi:DNA polymerase elongation subunit (family B)